jgi:predicted DNA-binding protein
VKESNAEGVRAMTLTINLNAEAESRLKTAATRRGLEPEVYAKQIIEEHLPAAEDAVKDQATLDLLARWDAEDATTDPAALESRRKELEEFKQAMNENRLRAEGPHHRRIFP